MKAEVDKLTEKLLSEIQEKNQESSKGVGLLEDELQKKIEQLNQFDTDYIKIVSECNECGKNIIETDKKYEKLKASIEDYRDKIDEYKKKKNLIFLKWMHQ